MKPKTLAMAVPTMLAISIGFGALFVYIEEKKYEALLYQKERDELQARIDASQSFNTLAQEIALKAPNTPLSMLYYSHNLKKLSEAQIREIVSTHQNDTLSTTEINAIKTLLNHD